MNATERLRQLLDERGVEWEGEEANSILHDGKFLYTYWCKGMHCFTEPIGAKEGTLGALTDFSASGFTPEQAVEATLGSDEVADLREALADLWPRASFTMCPENRESWLERLAELGVEVDA